MRLQAWWRCSVTVDKLLPSSTLFAAPLGDGSCLSLADNGARVPKILPAAELRFLSLSATAHRDPLLTGSVCWQTPRPERHTDHLHQDLRAALEAEVSLQKRQHLCSSCVTSFVSSTHCWARLAQQVRAFSSLCPPAYRERAGRHLFLYCPRRVRQWAMMQRRRKNSPWRRPLVEMTQGRKAYLRAAYPAL